MKRSRQANNPRYLKLYSTPSERGDIEISKSGKNSTIFFHFLAYVGNRPLTTRAS